MYARDGWGCRYCGVVTSQRHGTERRTIDHVFPRSRGGTTVVENLVVSCERCNSTKGHATLAELRWQLLPVPDVPVRSPLIEGDPVAAPAMQAIPPHLTKKKRLTQRLPPLDPADLF